MITITYNEDGFVTRVGGEDTIVPKGAVVVDAIPPMPTLADDETAELYYIDGALMWRKHSVEPQPPPPPPSPPTPPTEEELAEMRRQAYVAECDPLSMAYVGYMLEGDEAKAESAKASYLTRKAEIRKRFKE